ncbi:hypothetical protein EMPS_05752 [Entomortierella parvispora]|uniref:Uncharacterized protein n=1 Tax=Entomortierella parvispora TaxID=205924 RepID=A0A9P3HAX3_9FUNG|nr:hypothetical protein EMPS_05752 [Entomortierella parvispora]
MVPGARKLSVGSVQSRASSVYSVGSIGSVGTINGSGDGYGGGSSHSFYNLSKSCNNSSVDLNHFVQTTLPPPPAFPPTSTLASRTFTPPAQSPPPGSAYPALLPHRPVVVGSLYCNSNLSQSNLSLSRHNTCGNSLYSLGSNANSSSFSLASSQMSQFSQFSSGDKVQHAIGSMPAIGVPLPPSLLSSSRSSPNIGSSTSSFISPSHPFSASSSSLPLAASVNTPITTPATNTTKALSSASSLTSRHRSHPQPQSPQHQNRSSNKHTSIGIRKDNNNFNNSRPVSSSSSSDLALSPPTGSSSSPSPAPTNGAKANPSAVPDQYQLRPLLLPPVATLGLLPPRKKIEKSNTTSASILPPLNTKSLPRLPQKPSSVSVNSLSPAFVSGYSPSHSHLSSHSNTMMTSTSPSSAGSHSPAVSSPTSSAPSPNSNSNSSSSHQQQPFASLAITELVITEAQNLATIQRVAHALNQTMENTVNAGRKESATIRTLVDRWSDLMRVHAKFHDDIVAVNEDLRETASLINCMLVTLEPTLVDHGRDLSNALKKLIRRDQNSEHTFAEWDSALRQPFEHLSVYDDWMHRIDPQDNLCRDYRAHLNGLIYKIKMVTEANQHPRNMLRRLSTIAKTVINKRRTSLQLLNLPPTPETPSSMDMSSEYRKSQEEGIVDTPSTTAASTPVDKDGHSTFLPSPKTIQELDISPRPSYDQHRPQQEQKQQEHHEEQQQQQQQQHPDIQEDQEQEQEQERVRALETVMEPVSAQTLQLCPLTPLSPTFISTAVYLETTVTDFHVDERLPKAGDRTSTYLTPIKTQLSQLPTHQLPHRASAASDLSSAGTLAVSPSSPSPSTASGTMLLPMSNNNNNGSGCVANSVSSSSSSIRSKTSSTAETVITIRPQSSASTLNSSSSLIRQKFLAEKEARKATLRVGTCETIQARAECLQSPTASVHSAGLSSGGYTPGTGKGGYGAYYQARASFDATRVSPTRPVGDKANKPPVKSLISFWEQVSDPMEL